MLIYFCFKYENVISLRNHRKCGNRELGLCSSTQHVFLSQLSAESEVFVGFSGSPTSTVKRKMYFSSELGFVACVCYGKSTVAKFQVKSSMFYFSNKNLPTGSEYVLSLFMGLSWGCLLSFDEIVTVFKASELYNSLLSSSSTIAYQCTNTWTCFCSLSCGLNEKRTQIQKSGLLCNRNGVNVVKITKWQMCPVFVGIIRHRKMCAGVSNKNILLLLNEDLLC